VEPTTSDSVLQDPKRLAALKATGMLDTPPEESIDRFSRLARKLLRAPIARLSLVDDHRQFHKSRIGPEGTEQSTEAPFSNSICQHVVATGEPLAAGNLHEHPDLKDNGAVTEDGVTAYAGVPIRLRRGQVVGVFCVVDSEEREWTDDDMRILTDLGAAVAAEIELRAELIDRARVEGQLALANARLRGILDHSSALIYLKDLEGRYLIVNKLFAETLGLPENEIVGRRDSEILDERSTEVVRAEEEQVLATGEAVEELRHLGDPDGDQWWRTFKYPLRNGAGQIYALCGIATDETTRVAHERSLAAAHETVRAAFDDAPIGMAMLHAGRFVRANTALCDLLGYTEPQLCELTMTDVTHPDDMARDRVEIDRLLRGEIRTLQADARLIAADGSEREVLLNSTAIGGDDGKPPSAVSLQVQDITERRRARREINLRHEASRVLFDADDIVQAAPDALAPMADLIEASLATLWLAADEDGPLHRIAAWSRAGLPPARQPGGDATLRQRVMDEGHTAWNERSICVPVQTSRTASLLGVTEFLRENGPPSAEHLEHLLALTGGIALFLERRRHDAELARARDEALEASKMKSTFLANMSHEIRTPMNGVIGMTDLLLSSGLTDEQRRWATTLRTSGRALLTVIDDVLDFSKVEAGKLELERVQFDLREVIDATVDILTEQARTKGLALEAFIERRVPERMWGDPGRLQQVLTNIMANAVKFTDRGGVTLRVSLAPDDDNELRVDVTDTGIGIAAEVIQGLFEPFSQADASTTRRYGGTGLGLTISRQIVELMGGVIGATSSPGQGTTFYFTAPMGRVADRPGHGGRRATDRYEPPFPEATSNGIKVLVVDDNQVNQMVAAEMLRRSGYAVEIAQDGRQAVEATAREAFDAVLMDCQMPVMDGLEATRQIRTREADGGTHVPIIALTSSSMKGDRDDALASGMDGFLAKPVTAEALTSTVAHWTREVTPQPPSVPAPAPAPAPAQEILDASVFGALSVAADPGLGAELARLFTKEAAGALAGLRAALASEDGDDVARAAHGLKGSSSTLGAVRVSALAADIERAGRAERLADAARLLEELAPAVDAATAALNEAARNGSG
jgi:PAS domain S-box-containing protein